MNRIIRFRVWNINEDRWDTFDGSFNHTYLIYEEYIGKHDINKVEIYEGDIVEYVEKMDDHGDTQTLQGVVVYCHDSAAFAIASLNNSDSVWNYFSDMTISNIKVIGNIHEKKS